MATETLIAGRSVVSATMRGQFAGIDAWRKSFEVDQACSGAVRDGKAEEIWEIVDSAGLLHQFGMTSLPGS